MTYTADKHYGSIDAVLIDGNGVRATDANVSAGWANVWPERPETRAYGFPVTERITGVVITIVHPDHREELGVFGYIPKTRMQ